MPAALKTINYEGIFNKDPLEIRELIHACQPPPVGKGIFYLDLRCPSGKQVLLDLPKIDQGILSYFGQPTETKMNDYRQGVERGFKHPGEVIETFEINRRENLEGSHDVPPGLQSCKAGLSSMIDTGHLITQNLLAALHPPSAAELAAGTGPSDTGLKLYLQDAAAAVPAQALGRNIVTAGGDHMQEWTPVEPKEGCVVVNVGDALQATSGNRAHAPLHRVVQPESPKPGGTCMVVYFLRPEQKQEEPKILL
ncbi:hypothetical protein PG994_003427 [Apiospora phragmitis]|uniref:Isopenicillin N synthase-like Fe(2+) 2OG dioxygenase domain-containing protein n=1 Tax=Apiospora phragmitis TaxID=2905665 RepID=A0ABR1VY19_9PEZI